MKVSELKQDLDALSNVVKVLFEHVRAQFTAQFQEIHHAMDARFEAFRQEVREEIVREGAATRKHLDEEIAREGSATRTHFDVVAEGIKADAAQFMTRVTTLDGRVAVLRSEHATLKEALENHEIRLSALERHQG